MRRGVQQVAVKRLTTVTDPMLLNTIRKEISILQRVSFDRNVVQFYGAWLKDAAHAMLVMEFCEVRRVLLAGTADLMVRTRTATCRPHASSANFYCGFTRCLIAGWRPAACAVGA